MEATVVVVPTCRYGNIIAGTTGASYPRGSFLEPPTISMIIPSPSLYVIPHTGLPSFFPKEWSVAPFPNVKLGQGQKLTISPSCYITLEVTHG